MELIESRRYFFCRHCGSFHFPEPVSAEGIRVLGRTGDAPLCPLCKAPLAAALGATTVALWPLVRSYERTNQRWLWPGAPLGCSVQSTVEP